MRNQYDIVIYKRSYPKLDFGGGISGFLVASVIATLEVQTHITQQDFSNAAKAAHNSKKLTPNVVTSFHTGYVPPGILNYIVAYDGPASMNTIHGWIGTEYQKLGISLTAVSSDDNTRTETAADAIDAIFVLGKGFLFFDNTPISFVNTNHRQQNPSSKWVFADTISGNLLLLFLMLQGATANIEGKWLNSAPYLSTFTVPDIKWGS